MAGQQGAKKGSFLGKALGFLLGVGILGGLVWYLFFSPNAPFKKKTEQYTFTSTCFSTLWTFTISSTWAGPAGTVTLTPSNQAPQPNQNNNWEDSVTYNLSASGGSLISISLVLDVEVGGGDNGKRHDLAWVDGALVFDQTNTFAQSCSSPGKISYPNIYSRGSQGSFTLRHKVELSKTGVENLKKNMGVFVQVVKN